MKRFIIPIILALAAASANAGCRWNQQHDSLQWKGDKRAHLTWSAVGGGIVEAGDALLDLDMKFSTKVGLAVLPGFLREVKTACGDGPGGFSHQDMVYNVVGSIIGVGLGEGVRLILTPRSVHVAWELQ